MISRLPSFVTILRMSGNCAKYVRLLATKFRGQGLELVEIPLSALLWEAIERSEGLETVIELENEMGFERSLKTDNQLFDKQELAATSTAPARKDERIRCLEAYRNPDEEPPPWLQEYTSCLDFLMK